MTLTRLSSTEKHKGYDIVLESLKEIVDEYPAIKYLIVGKYDIAEKQRLDELINKLALKNIVVLAGFVPDEELANHYNLADVFIMPSKKEGFGLVFIEALYYGLPVIAGNKDGSVDALSDGALGVLINPDNQQEIIEAIKNTINNKDRYLPKMELVMEKFSYTTYKKNVKKILDNYE